MFELVAYVFFGALLASAAAVGLFLKKHEDKRLEARRKQG